MKRKRRLKINIIIVSCYLTFWGCNIFGNGPAKVFAFNHDVESTADLYSVCMANSKVGWTVGDRGTIYVTYNGGLKWEKQKIKCRLPLFSVSFVNEKVGWITGKSGTIFHTRDGGKTWNLQTAPKKKHLFKVKALSPQKCWAAGDWGTILYTEDGGETWLDKTCDDDIVFYDIAFHGEKCGWIAGEFGTILHTRDGGLTWEKQNTGIENTLFTISFTSKQVGLAAGLDGVILKTVNGGETWSRVNGFKERNFEKMKSVYELKLDSDLAIAAGDAGWLSVSKDAGDTWNIIDLPLEMELYWLRGVSVLGKMGIVVGARSLVIITHDGSITALGFVPNIERRDAPKN